MIRSLLLLLLAVGLAACASPENLPTDSDTTGVVVPEEPPEVPVVAEVLVGRWSHANGNYLEFRGDGTVSLTGRDMMELGYRVIGDSVVIADPDALLNIEAVPTSNRYFIASLNDSELMLEPAGGMLGGQYTRDGMPADTTGM